MSPSRNLWQSSHYEQLQQSLGRETFRLSSGVLVVAVPLPFGLHRYDVLRADLTLDDTSEILQRAQADGVTGLRLAFATEKGLEAFQEEHPDLPLREHEIQQHPAATRIIDISHAQDETFLATLESQGRRHVRAAQKAELEYGDSVDLEAFWKFQQLTAGRQGFQTPPRSFYESLESAYGESFWLRVVRHPVDRSWLAAGIFLRHEQTLYYYYGASVSSGHHQAPTLLQYEAMREGAASGCKAFDLLGISHPDAPEDDSLQGVTRFKRKFGGEVWLYGPEQMLILRPFWSRFLRVARRLYCLVR